MEYSKAETAAPAVPIPERDVHGHGNTDIWLFAYFHMEFVVIQTTASNLRCIHQLPKIGGISLTFVDQGLRVP